jgi:hypothetical protein
MVPYEHLDELRKEVENNGGIVATTMQELRDAYGARKLGVHVRTAISNELAGRGLGHVPAELPEYQHYEVLIFRLGSDIARVVQAVQSPSAQSAALLRDLAQSEARTRLEQIRALLE